MFFWMELIFTLIIAVVFGCATQSIVSNKGYDENWFWWGFFFGVIAVIVALTKPERTRFTQSPEASAPYYENKILKNNGWVCAKCQKTNPHYTGTCSCGNTKGENEQILQQKEKKEIEAENIEKLKKLKELLDSGIITQEEFEKKKEELLNEIL